jgi:hypothetical protein
MLLIFEFVDVVESHAASLAQLTQTKHPAPSKLPQLCPIYLYESLYHDQHYTYFLLTIQPRYERIWVAYKDGPAGGATPRDPAHKEKPPRDTAESSVFRPSETSEDHHPHACTDGLVFLTYSVFDEALGEEVERLEVVPCRRCADSR